MRDRPATIVAIRDDSRGLFRLVSPRPLRQARISCLLDSVCNDDDHSATAPFP